MTSLFVGLFAAGTLAGCLAAAGPPPLSAYLDSHQPIDRRADDLLGRMTLAEKIGQMNMPCVYVGELGKDAAAKMEGCRRFAAGTKEPGVGPGGGFFTLSNTILHEGPRQQAEFLNELQHIAVEKTRLRIPLLQCEEGTHGLMAPGGTVFPEGMALGSTWNLDLLRRIYAAAALEARAIGVHQLFTLVVEPTRDPRMGRNEEGYSEDPYLCARIAESVVEAVQGADVSAPDKVVAGLCHYPGQGEGFGGLERGAMQISERTLRSVFLPPFTAGIRGRGALGVMATYPAIDGVPVHASGHILTEILRDELGFQGLVLSEGHGISTLLYEGLAADLKQAGALALKAGVDVGISYEQAFLQGMADNVKEGKVPMALIDRAVRRILMQKFRLGLFEKPYVDPERAVRVSHTPAHTTLALEAAREGIVLLRNDKKLLPLDKNIRSVAVIGPNADDRDNMLGDYTAMRVLQPVTTVLAGIRAAVPAARVEYVKGCDVTRTALDEIERARQAARRAEIAVVVVGESLRANPRDGGTDGEGIDVASLDLSGRQQELVEAVAGTGTPTVVVLINGRPLSVRWIAEHVPAVLEAWNCGEQGGRAVADVLFGDRNPSGRLSVTIPRHVGQLPTYYDYPPSKEFWLKRGVQKAYIDLGGAPLYPFGYGLSYTQFAYSNLRIDQPRIAPEGEVVVSADIRNTGSRVGSEVVQLYLRDMLSSVTTPARRLAGFEKIRLEPGQSKTVRFRLSGDQLSLVGRDLRRVVEPGVFRVMVGRSSAQIELEGSFEVLP